MNNKNFFQEDVINALNESLNDIINSTVSSIKDQVAKELTNYKQELTSQLYSLIPDIIKSEIAKNSIEPRLSKTSADRLAKARSNRMKELLGDSKGDKYKLYVKYYQNQMSLDFSNEFGVLWYSHISPRQYGDALSFIQNFNVNLNEIQQFTEAIHNDFNSGRLDDSLRRPYERYFNIK